MATAERYRKLMDVSEGADDTGLLRMLLVLAWHTGRRISAITHLRASDVLLTQERVTEALDAEGMDAAWAEEWSNAIRWRSEWDKSGFGTISPISPIVVREVEAYLRRNARVGDAWLFTMETNQTRPPSDRHAGYYLRRAEKLAGLPRIERGGWHVFRRAWATARKGLPTRDVMLAGGWRNPQALRNAYQAADAKTTREVVEFGETG